MVLAHHSSGKIEVGASIAILVIVIVLVIVAFIGYRVLSPPTAHPKFVSGNQMKVPAGALTPNTNSAPGTYGGAKVIGGGR